jgi:precorrin-3B methylase
MIDGDFPIYDSMVSEFYKLPLISGSNLTQKITQARSAIDLLKKEQDKIIQGGQPSIYYIALVGGQTLT